MNVLLVEDYDQLRAVTAEVIAAKGHVVHALPSAEALGELVFQQPLDVAVLDLNLPGEDGLSLAQRLYQTCPGIGIVMLTVRHTLADKLAGYERGADVYLTKPCEPEELCAAIEALGRRIRAARAPNREAIYTLNVSKAQLITPQGVVDLRSAEVLFLQGLALAPEGKLEYWQLIEKLDKPMDEAGKAQLEVLVSRLRQKLQSIGIVEPGIKSERGKGYRLCMPIKMV